MKHATFAAALAVCIAIAAQSQAQAQRRIDHYKPRGHGPVFNWKNPYGVRGGPGVRHRRGRPVVVRPGRIRSFRTIRVIRPKRRLYMGYGRFHRDAEAYKWLAFTAITLTLLDNLNESQQRIHEQAQIEATSARVGEKITWYRSGATGSITAVREGTSSVGRYCREFQQTVTIGGETERAFGTACRRPDGTWELVSTGS